MSSSAILLCALFTPAAAAAQLIVVRTVAIADADQFSFFPSLLSGMGGVTIAVADSVHDPFVNPATGARTRHPLFFSTPTVFSVSGGAGRGSTYPLGAIGRAGASFGGAAIAIQSITEGHPPGAGIAPELFSSQSTAGRGSRSNRYGYLMLGRAFAASRLALGASALWSDLGSIDGTRLLYAESRGVRQVGRLADVRLGMLKEWKGSQSLEALVVNRRVRMTHDVTYGDLYWDPLRRQTILRDRFEHEQDQTRVWGMHLEYARPIGDSGWRGGVVVTANRLDNPKRPAHEFETVPGDRGRASAFNVGVGVARSVGATTFAADAIYEPIWSRIWAVSDSAGPNAGTTFQLGDQTIDSRLRFSNATLRTGFSHERSVADDDMKLRFQLGVQARSIYYTLDQRDLVQGTVRRGDRNWMEWTRSWGAAARRGTVQLQYRGRTSTGAGRPGINPSLSTPPPGVLSADFIRLPSAPLMTLRDVSVVTHQLSLSLFIR